jgi:hypothetical protein
LPEISGKVLHTLHSYARNLGKVLPPLQNFNPDPGHVFATPAKVSTESQAYNSDLGMGCPKSQVTLKQFCHLLLSQHTVSFSTRTSSRIVSSGWHITISPTLFDSMLCILSNLEFYNIDGAKIVINLDKRKK